jgi:hypothetical protein
MFEGTDTEKENFKKLQKLERTIPERNWRL